MTFHSPRQKSRSQIKADNELASITARAVGNAHHFTCTIFANHSYRTLRETTLAGARALRPRLEAEANNHRKAMIYACTNDGMTYFVPDDFVA